MLVTVLLTVAFVFYLFSLVDKIIIIDKTGSQHCPVVSQTDHRASSRSIPDFDYKSRPLTTVEIKPTLQD
jgi:hypothetical protein